MPNLGTFFLLAFFGPGIVIFSTLILLWPELRVLFGESKVEIYALIVMTISLLNGHVPWIAEKIVFEPIWRICFTQYDALLDRFRGKDLVNILVTQEANGYDHKYYDLMFGEFVLYFNSSFWLLVISCARLIYGSMSGLVLLATLIVLPVSLVALFYTAPVYKMAYIRSVIAMDALETVTRRIR